MLEIFTLILAVATIYLAYQTHRLASLTSYAEETRLRSDRNWRLWDSKEETHGIVYPQNLNTEIWRWRIAVLGVLDVLFIAYRRETLLLARLASRAKLEPYLTHANKQLQDIAKDNNGVEQIRRILQKETGDYPPDFLNWLKEQDVDFQNLEIN